MKQIKTIFSNDPEKFDTRVNTALEDGWMMTNRYTLPGGGFVAELEREVITEAEHICDNCLHADKAPEDEPCLHCSEDCDKWEAAW